MKRVQIVLLILIFLPGKEVFTQGTFHKILYDTVPNAAYCVKPTSDSNFIVSGNFHNFLGHDLMLLKVNMAGEIEWKKSIGNDTNSEFGGSFLVLDNDDIIITGGTHNAITSHDVLLMKVNAEGDSIWTKVYGGDKSEGGQDICKTYDNGYIICGYTYSYGNEICKIFIIKTNTDGDTLWTKTIGEDLPVYGRNIINTPDSGYLISGHTHFNNPYNRNCYFLKLNNEGDTLWSTIYEHPYYDEPYDLIQAYNNGYLAAGAISVLNDENTDILLLRLDSDGDILWTKTLGGPKVNMGMEIIQTFDSSYLLVGLTGDYPDRDIRIIKIDTLGNSLWVKDIDGNDIDRPQSLFQYHDSSFVIVGHTSVNSTAYSQLLRVDKNGNLNLNAIDDTINIFENIPQDTIIGNVLGLYNNGDTLSFYENGFELLYSSVDSALSIDQNYGYISVFDSSLIDYELHQFIDLIININDSLNSDIAHIFIEIKDVNENPSSEEDNLITDFRIFPNPSTGSVSIEFGSNLNSVIIELINIYGTIINKRKICNQKIISLDYSNYSPGLYFILIRREDYLKMKKLILN